MRSAQLNMIIMSSSIWERQIHVVTLDRCLFLSITYQISSIAHSRCPLVNEPGWDLN